MKHLKTIFACLLMAVLSIGQVWGETTVDAENYEFTQSSTPTGWSVGSSNTQDASYLKLSSGDYVEMTTASIFTSGEIMSSSTMDVEVSCGTFGSWSGNKSVKVTVELRKSDGTVLSTANSTFSSLSNKEGAYKSAISVSKPTNPSQIAYLRVTFSDFTTGSTLRMKNVRLTYETDEAPSSGCEKHVTISAGVPSHGTFTLSKTGAQATCDGAVSVVVTPIPAEHYHATGVTASNSSSISGPDGDGKYTVTYAQNTNAASEINVTFAENDKHTVTWNNNGDQSVTTQVYDGEKPSFPSTPVSCDGTSTTFIGWATASWTGKAANLSGKTVYTSANAMPAVSADIEYFAVFAKGTSAPEVDHDGPSFSRSGTTDTYTSGYTFTAQAESKSGYYQDGSGTDRYVQVLNTSTPIFSATPSSITVTATIGGGTAGKDLSNPVYAQLLDNTGATIGTAAVVTEHITTNTGDTYSNISLSTTGITSAYGLRISHVKESGYNVRYYSFSLSYTTGGTTYSDYMTTCTAAGTVATPTFSVIAGTYNVAKSVELECETEGATIYYTTNGNAPTSSSTEYTGAISVDKSMTIKAIAIKDGLTDSEVAEAAYTLKCLAPTITKTPKHFLETATVTITCAEGETIHYTLDGNDPTTSSASYSAPFSIDATTTVKAIAVKANWSSSEVASETFTKAETPLTVAQARGVIDGGTGLTGRYVVGQIYQIDSYDGTHKSLTYWISDDGTSSNPLEVYSGKGIDGADFSAITDLSVGDIVTVYGELKKYNSTYEFNYNNEIAKIVKNVATPTFTPLGSGFLSNTLEVSLATTETGEGVEIRYTTDGSEPTSTSTLYENPIEISATTTFKAATFKGGNASAVVEKKYVKGTKINVAAALEALDSNDPIANQFVYGIVSTAPTYISSGKLIYSISDDGTTTSQLKVYNGYNLAGANFTDKTDIQVGDLVTVFGELTEYNSEKEFSQGNHLVEFARLADPELSWSAASAVVGITGEKNYPSIVNPHTETGITYSSSDPTVASFADENTYAITLHKAGTVTITATYSAGNGYKNDEASYTLEVRDVLAYVTITYDCDEATTGCPDPTVVENQTNLPDLLPTVTKTGFNFGGWFTNAGKTEAAVAGAALTADVTLYAKWIEIPTFNNENYEWQLVSSDAQLVANNYYVIGHAGKGVTATNVLTSGYLGKVASTIADGVIAYNALGTNTAVFQLGGNSTDGWTLNEVLGTETGLLGGAGSSNLAWGGDYTTWPISIDEDGNATIGSTTSGENRILYNSSSPRFKTYTSGLSASMLLPQLYVWAEKTFKLHYDANGGENAPATQPAVAGEATVTSSIPTYTDKIFVNWNTEIGGTGDSKVAGDVIDLSSADVTLYAQWRDPYDNITISYDANGGTLKEGESAIADATDQVEGSLYTLEANVYEKAGYTFGGWKAYDALDNELTITSNKITVPSTNVTVKAQWISLNITDFILVTNVNQLQNGDKVYIVAAGDRNFAAGALSGSVLSKLDIQKTTDKQYIVLPDGATAPVEYTVGISGDQLTLQNGTQYLYSTTVKNMGLRNDAFNWTVSITEDGIATLSCSVGNLKYNASQPRFTTYASGQQDIALYKKANYPRAMTDGRFGTICLPNSGIMHGAQLFEVAYIDNTQQKIFFDEVEGGVMIAGRPYIFLKNDIANNLGVVYTGSENASAGNYRGLYGSYSEQVLEKEAGNYVLYNNQYLYVASTSTNVKVGANRAYIKIGVEGGVPTSATAPAPGRRRVSMDVVGAPQVTTGVGELNADETPVKVMINGQLYIIRGEKMYDATGRLVK